MEEDVDGVLADLENLNYDDLDSVSKLQKSQRYIDIMQVIHQYFSYMLVHLLSFLIVVELELLLSLFSFQPNI